MWLFFLLFIYGGFGEVKTHGLDKSSPYNSSVRDIEVLKSEKIGIEFLYTPAECIFEPSLYIPNTYPQPEPGKPALRVKYVIIGVPIASSVSLQIIESQTAESTGVYILPAYGFEKKDADKEIYSKDAFWPATPVSIEQQTLYRAQEVVRLRINPLRYNPQRNTLLIYKKLRIRVNFHGGKGVPRPDKLFDPVFKSVLINYEQAKNWRKEKKIKFPPYHPGPWYKIELQGEGIYKIGKEQLKNAGIPWTNPNTIKLYNGGSKMVTDSLDTLQEIPIRILPDTSILFYAASLSGWGKNGEAFLNPYTYTNVYWLTYGGEQGRRDSVSGTISPNLPTPISFPDTIHVEEDHSCPAKSGLGWIWHKLERDKDASSLKTDYSFNARGVYQSNCVIKFAVYGWFADGSRADESNNMWHCIRVYLNGTAFFDTCWKAGDESPRIFKRPATGLKEGSNTFTFELYNGGYGTRDMTFFDWFEVIYERKYEAQDGNLKFKGTEPTQKFEIHGFHELPVIFNISRELYPRAIYGAVYDNGVVKFKGGEEAYYASTNFKTPSIKKESPYNLRNLTKPVDFVIITPSDFLDYAKSLKSHREKQGLETGVFLARDIYNNFSWGLDHSPYAIRNFLSFAHDNWETGYCLLLGAATFNYRDTLSDKNRIPPWEMGYKVGEYGYPPSDQHCHDWWFAPKNMAIGRITSGSKAEARDAIHEKIFKYEKNLGVWQNRVLLIADDENPDGCTFVNYTEGLANEIPEEIDISRIYLMNYPDYGGIKPTARSDLIRQWSKGPFLTLFAGHGNLKQLCHEQVFMYPTHVEALSNGIKLPFTHFWSCGVGCFERENIDGIAALLQKIKGKGSIATVAATRITSTAGDLPHRIIRFLFTEPQRRIGQVVFGVNLELPLAPNITLFADPSTLLPNRSIGVVIDSFPDTLKGGYPLRIWGKAPTAKFAHITVRSAEYIYNYTPANCQYKMRGRIINEQLCEDILFEGTVKVENGNWYQEFFIPVELDILICGEGKISVSAWNDTACGSTACTPVIMQGEDNPNDTLGPRIELYANGRLIRDGDMVPSNFILTGVLQDESGINTFNKIIPLDLVLTLKINTGGEPKHLADYFRYDVGSSRRGSFDYPLTLGPTDIEDTLYLQASDNLGNRNTESVRVKVVSSARLELTRIMNYPNPVSGEHTSFTFFLSKPASVNVKIYTIAGRLIRTIPAQNKPPGFNKIYWDTRDELGNRVGNGIYIYKLIASSEGLTKEETSQISKLMILR